MALFGSDSPDERVQNLVDNAKHESVSTEVLSKKKASGWGSHNYLNDSPLIHYLNEEEQPHFIFPLAAVENQGVLVEGGNDLLPNGKLRTNVVITDKRILIAVGKNSGDEIILIEYPEIVDAELINESDSNDQYLDLIINTDVKSFRIRRTTVVSGEAVVREEFQEALRYIRNNTNESKNGKSKNLQSEIDGKEQLDRPSKSNESVSESQKSFSRKFEIKAKIKKYGGGFAENSNNNGSIVFGKEKMVIDGNEEIAYSDLCHMRNYDYHHYNAKENTTALLNKYQFTKIKGTAIRFKVRGGGLLYIDEYIVDSDSMAMNKLDGNPNREAKNRIINMDGPKFDPDLIEFLNSVISDELIEGAPEKILIERIGTESLLQIDGWKDNSSEIKLTGESTGKSKGYEIGPFTRSKSKSESVMTGEITDDEFEKVIQAALVFKDRIYIDSSPELDILFSDIDRVLHSRDKGFDNVTDDQVVIETGNNSFRILCTVDNEVTEYMSRRVRKTKQNATSSTPSDNEDSDVGDRLREVKELYEEGILTEEEFESKKQELLDDL